MPIGFIYTLNEKTDDMTKNLPMHNLRRISPKGENALLERAGWKPLPHRSKECSPCVNANRTDFRHLSDSDIDKVRRNEQETGRNMFRPP